MRRQLVKREGDRQFGGLLGVGTRQKDGPPANNPPAGYGGGERAGGGGGPSFAAVFFLHSRAPRFFVSPPPPHKHPPPGRPLFSAQAVKGPLAPAALGKMRRRWEVKDRDSGI